MVKSATRETSTLMVKTGWEVLVVCKEDSPQDFRRTIETGRRAPMHATASGKIFLAHLPEDALADYLSTTQCIAYTKDTITNPEDLQSELEVVRSRGVGYNRDEIIEGISAAAIPVFDMKKRIIAAIVAAMPALRFTPQKEKECIGIIREASAKLSMQFGGEKSPFRGSDWPGSAMGGE